MHLSWAPIVPSMARLWDLYRHHVEAGVLPKGLRAPTPSRVAAVAPAAASAPRISMGDK
jgi:hypothetical protein